VAARSSLSPFLWGVLAAVAAGAVGLWLFLPPSSPPTLREPIPENLPGARAVAEEENPNPGTLIAGPGKPSDVTGTWSQFRGARRDNLVDNFALPGSLPGTLPPVLWSRELSEGHSGAAIHAGCAYLMDYDEEKKEDIVLCLSLDQGEEIWRYTYYSKIKRNHGTSRTIPAVTNKYVVTLGPKCQVHCLNRLSGEKVWSKDLVSEYGAVVPEWYAGQCPLVEEDRVILAPGGQALMVALDIESGTEIWRTPNELGWRMTHTSIAPVHVDGTVQYVWPASAGVVGIDAVTGKLLWHFDNWNIKIATIPSPVDLGEGRVLLTGGYNAGATMLQIRAVDNGYTVEEAYHLEATVFGSDQQTPIFSRGVVYGVIPSGQLACLSTSGDVAWVHPEEHFGLGPYLLVGDKLLLLDDRSESKGTLQIFKVSPLGAERLASWPVLSGHDLWAPMALAGGRLLLRDANKLVCLDLSGLLSL
jgi:outer membrane protein assembly factor BamB